MDVETPSSDAPMPSSVAAITPDTATPVESVVRTGLTPEQVFQELKKSGYLDKLRREMFDAFISPPSNTTAKVGPAPAAPVEALAAHSTNAAESSSIDTAVRPSPVGPSASTLSEQEQPITPATNAAATDTDIRKAGPGLSSKQDLNSFLDTVLRSQLEKDHNSLRVQDPRNQLDTLLKHLDSEAVPASAQHPEQLATVYEQLIENVAKPAPGFSDSSRGILSKDGRVGKEASQRITDLITDLRQPTSKQEEEDEDDADDDKVVEQSSSLDDTTVDIKS